MYSILINIIHWEIIADYYSFYSDVYKSYEGFRPRTLEWELEKVVDGKTSKQVIDSLGNYLDILRKEDEENEAAIAAEEAKRKRNAYQARKEFNDSCKPFRNLRAML